MLAGGRHLHGARARFTRHFQIAKFVLQTFNVFLHFLGLGEQSLNIATHVVQIP